jgi:hypothetical protein
MGFHIYEVRVLGEVPPEVLREIGVLGLDAEPPLTILQTEPTDQSGLQGLLQQLRNLGLDLLEVRSHPATEGLEALAPEEPAP